MKSNIMSRSLLKSSSIAFLLIVILHSASNHESNAAATGETDYNKSTLVQNIRIHPTNLKSNDIWDYLLSQYSSANTQGELQQLLVKPLQKCDNILNDSASSSSDSCASSLKFPYSIDNLQDLNVVFAQVLKITSEYEGCCYKIPTGETAQEFTLAEVNKKDKLSPDSSAMLSEFDERNDQGGDRKKPTAGEVWGYGFLLVTIISACSVVGVSVLPVMDKKAYKYILTTMIGLAVGSLTGSSVFHLMPQAFDLSSNDPCHDYLFTSLVVSGGIWMFFMVERILKIIMDYKDRKDKAWRRVKASSLISSTPENSTISMLVDNHNHLNHHHPSNEERNTTTICTTRDSDLIYESQEQAIKASFGHQEKPKSTGHDHIVKFEQGKDSVIATVAWMIIFGDGLHNFIDGLSIGAALNESILTGVSISVAVLCEELPHELGDFAVLLNAGMSMRQAVTYNFLSACTCYLGMAIGIFLGEVEASSYIFALASGMFLYISLVDMVPEMNEVAEQASKVSVKKAFWILVLQNMGIFIGITALFILAKYQDHIKF